MFKKTIICLLTLVFILCGATALGAEPVNDELARVTQNVKTILSIDDSYTDFYGEQQERGYGVSWYLNWSSPEGNLNVEVDGDDQIISYHRYSYGGNVYSGYFAPKFPQDQSQQARKIAQAFADRVLGENETAIFQDSENQLLYLREQSSYYFSGNIAINGVPAPLNVSVSVNAADMTVTSFWRDSLSTSYIGAIPSAVPKITAEAAKAKLLPLTKFKLGWYRSDAAKNEARLQYCPVLDNTYYIDAQNGSLVDMNKLYEAANDNTIDRGIPSGGAAMNGMAREYMASADMAAPQAAPLSPVEQSGVDKLEGLLTREELDAKARAITEFGLSKDHILSSFTYRQSYGENPGRYTAFLEYYRESTAAELGIKPSELKGLQDEGQKLFTYKYVSLDAATGDLEYLSTNRPYINELLITAKQQDYKAKAEAFLRKYCSDKFAQTAFVEQEESSVYLGSRLNQLQYVQQVKGYPFDENSLSISANPFTGEIENFYLSWNADVEFASAEGIINEAKAGQIYADALECRLVYRGLPEGMDPANPLLKPLLTSFYGYSTVYRLALVYTMEADYPDNVYAIDALEGKALTYAQQSKSELSYEDIAGHSAQAQIEKLAQHGIGFVGGKFQPAAQLTELDMVLFILSADGWLLDPAELPQEKIDEVYRQAYNLGILQRGERRPDRQISRGEFVKILISMSGYGQAAALPGIYVCNFADAAQIPAELYGYVAIGQGLALVSGGPDKSFKAGETINRGEAAVIFHNFLARKY